MLYSKNGSYPSTIPFRIVLSNGNTRTDPSSFTPEELADAGYISVPDKPGTESTQVLSWNSQTISWDIRDKTEEELRQEYLATIPSVVTMRQARLALLQQGLLNSVNYALSTMQGIEGEAARIEWEYAAEVYRDSPLVQSLSSGLGWTEQQILDLFALAETL